MPRSISQNPLNIHLGVNIVNLLLKSLEKYALSLVTQQNAC